MTREIFVAIVVMAVFCLLGLVFMFSGFIRQESAYKAACEKISGTAVWNGRYWECLK